MKGTLSMSKKHEEVTTKIDHPKVDVRDYISRSYLHMKDKDLEKLDKRCAEEFDDKMHQLEEEDWKINDAFERKAVVSETKEGDK